MTSGCDVQMAQLDQQLDSGEVPFFEVASDRLPLLVEGYEIGETLEEYHAQKK